MKISENIPIFVGPFQKNAPFFWSFWGSTMRFIYMKLLLQNQEKNTHFAIFCDELGCMVHFKKNAPFFWSFWGSSLRFIYIWKLFFKIKKKEHLLQFSLTNWGAFFLMNIGKTHLNSSPKIGQNIPIFAGPFQKTHLFFWSFNQPWDLYILYIYIKLLFQNQEKNAPFAIFSYELGCVFFSWILEKRTSIRQWKSPKYSNFCSTISKKRTFFFDDFRDRVFLGFTLENYIYETFFSKSRKKRTFCDFQWLIEVRFFFMNIGKTHLNWSLKIGQNIPISTGPV